MVAKVSFLSWYNQISCLKSVSWIVALCSAEYLQAISITKMFIWKWEFHRIGFILTCLSFRYGWDVTEQVLSACRICHPLSKHTIWLSQDSSLWEKLFSCPEFLHHLFFCWDSSLRTHLQAHTHTPSFPPTRTHPRAHRHALTRTHSLFLLIFIFTLSLSLSRHSSKHPTNGHIVQAASTISLIFYLPRAHLFPLGLYNLTHSHQSVRCSLSRFEDVSLAFWNPGGTEELEKGPFLLWYASKHFHFVTKIFSSGVDFRFEAISSLLISPMLETFWVVRQNCKVKYLPLSSVLIYYEWCQISRKLSIPSNFRCYESNYYGNDQATQAMIGFH